MEDFAKQQKRWKDSQEREKLSRETLGKFFYGLAKFVFTAMALVGGISLIMDEPQVKKEY